jgi:hypothetical protein
MRHVVICGLSVSTIFFPHYLINETVLFIIIIFSGSAAQRGLWPPVALQPSAGYGLLVHEAS